MSEARRARIGLILGSSSDLRHVKSVRDLLERFDEPYELIVASAHRTPRLVQQWTENAEDRGLLVIIAAAGAAAALPGTVAAHTTLPVVGLPLDTTVLRGVDSLYAIVQMPPGIPVATVGINNGNNAALLALAIVGLTDPPLRQRIDAYRHSLEEKVFKANRELYEEQPHLRPLRPGEPPLRPSERFKPPTEEAAAPIELTDEDAQMPEQPMPRTTMPQSLSRRLQVDPQSPDPESIERAVDVLLDGGVVAIPTDTVYGLAADASRPEAVRKLFQIKDRPDQKAIPLLIHSRRLLDAVASELPADILGLLEQHWPGPLTVIVKKYSGSFEAAAPGETVGLRIPNDPVALAILAMIGRPLAVSSANVAGGESARDADTIESAFGERVDLIIDTGHAGDLAESTVLDTTREPYRILRQGSVGRDQLAQALGEKLAPAEEPAQ